MPSAPGRGWTWGAFTVVLETVLAVLAVTVTKLRRFHGIAAALLSITHQDQYQSQIDIFI